MALVVVIVAVGGGGGISNNSYGANSGITSNQDAVFGVWSSNGGGTDATVTAANEASEAAHETSRAISLAQAQSVVNQSGSAFTNGGLHDYLAAQADGATLFKRKGQQGYYVSEYESDEGNAVFDKMAQQVISPGFSSIERWVGLGDAPHEKLVEDFNNYRSIQEQEMMDAFRNNIMHNIPLGGGIESVPFFYEILSLGSGTLIRGGTKLAVTATKKVVTNTLKKGYKHSFKYAKRVRKRALEDPTSHNFPYSFDDEILDMLPSLKNNGYKIFQKQGFMNGKSGTFEIGLKQNGIIDHRFFRPY